MSLIHWWPLNGNTKDYGTNNITLTETSAPSTKYVAGKIGQCYNFNGAAWLQASGVTVGTDCSVCCWAKTSAAGAMFWGMQCSGSDYMNLYNCGPICLNIGDSADNPFADGSTNVPATSDGIWHHYAVVFKGSEKAKIYIDGIYRGQAKTYRNPTMASKNFTIATWNYSSHGYYWNGGINDVRIYDHSLSIKEIKEIAKGLVLHYNFEDCFNKNLLSNSNKLDTSPWSNPSGSAVLQSDGWWKVSYTAGGWWGSRQSITLTAGITYTVSGWCRGDRAQLWFYKDGSNCGGSEIVYSGEKYITYSYTPSTSGDYYVVCYASSTSNNYYKQIKCEVGNTATIWTDGNENFTSVYDSSGYGNNATVVGDCRLTSDSMSGQYSLLNNSTNIGTNTSTGAAYIKGDLGASITPDKLTVSFWANVISYDYASSGIFSLSNNSSSPTDYSTNGINQYDNYFRFNLSGGAKNLTPSTIITKGSWHHYALVYNGSTLVGYKDGVAVETVSGASGTINAFRYIYLGLSVAGGVWRQSKENWGDFKIYTTALSAEDILAEYNRKAAIDRNGNLFTGEIIEHSSTTNYADIANYSIETQRSLSNYLAGGTAKKSYYDANYPNESVSPLGAYTQGNLSVTVTANGIRIYSKPNWDGRAIEGSGWDTWGGLCFSPMKNYNCLVKGHRYVLSWHMSGQSSRSLNSVHWSNQIGWGQSPDAGPTVNAMKLHPANFQGEMDCYYDFTITDDVFKATGSSVHSGFEANTTYLAYAAFKIGYEYGQTGELGTDVYITNLQLHDVTSNITYKIDKSNFIKTTELIAGRRNSARIHKNGMIDVTDIKEL